MFKFFTTYKREFIYYSIPLFISLFILLFFIYPLYQNLSYKKEVFQKRQEYFEQLKKKISTLNKEIATVKAIPKDLKSKVFWGQDPYVLVAALKQIVDQISETSIRSFRILQREKIDSIGEKVKVNFVLDTDIKGLAELLWFLQNDPRAIKIKRLSVSVRRGIKGERLSVILQVEGLFWKIKEA